MGDTGFKHISVTAAEEEDVVIRAGLGAAVGDAAAGGAAGGAEGQAPDPADDAGPAGEGAGSVGDGASRGDDGADDGISGRVPADAPRQPSDRPGAYRRTTLDDLGSSPMPGVQRIVIIAAVVCIIGALVYYLLCMR